VRALHLFITVWLGIQYIRLGIKIPGYLIDGEIRHLARLLKPHCRGPGKTDPPKALTAGQSLETRKSTSIPPEPCREVSGEIGASGGSFRLARAPMTSSKRPTPLAYFRLIRGTCEALWQDREPRGPPYRGTHSHRWDERDRAQ
jgi:hypothetical protein